MLHIYVSSRAGQARPGSTGQIVSGYEARIVDSDGSDVPAGVIGDLLVKGRSMAQGYWSRPDLTSDRMRGEWFFTGDKFRRDEAGFFSYAGRADEMFRVSGQWVSPYEIENALLEHPAVLEAAVVAYEEENELHTPKAFVVLKNGFTRDPGRVEELKEFVKQRIPPYKYPRRIEFLSELPKSAAGKILRFKLRQT
jgi:benzoate-CoA ligase